MALLERVSTLVRANLNDLIDRAEHPEKLLKQVILDMQNQLMQVKTQVAISIADEQLLIKKQKEAEERAAEWSRKAEIAVGKGQDDLARAALERSIDARRTAEGFSQQVADQKHQVENLKNALRKLEQKLAEARAKSDLLMAQHRRARTLGRATDARVAMTSGSPPATFDRLRDRVEREEAVSQARTALADDDVESRLEALSRDEEIERLLAEIKARNK
jgi:phage shock protein A